MRNHGSGTKGKEAGAAAANGARPVGSKRRKRRSWSAEEKIRIARESFPTQESVTGVAERYGIRRNRLSSWRSLLRRGQAGGAVIGAGATGLGFRRCRGGGTQFSDDRRLRGVHCKGTQQTARHHEALGYNRGWCADEVQHVIDAVRRIGAIAIIKSQDARRMMGP